MITGSVLGSGSKRRWSGTRWSVAGNVAIAWVITLPCAGLVGAGYAEVGTLPGGTEIIYALVAATVVVMITRRRTLFGTWEEEVARSDAAVAAAVPADDPPKRKRRSKALA